MNTTRVFDKLLNLLVDPNIRGVGSKGGTRSSKTWSMLQLLYILALKSEKALTISCVTDTLPAVKRGMLRDFKSMLLAEGLWKEECFNKSEGIYEFPSGTIIEFFGCDNAAKVHGPARDYLFINEAQRVPRETFRQLDVRTRIKVFIDYNPVRRFWGETEFSGERYVTITSTYLDNPFLTSEQVAAIERNKKDVNWWRVYGTGETGGTEGNVYPDITIIDEIPENVKGCLGLDFGFVNDPTAIVRVAFNGWNLYLDELCYNTNMLNNAIADYLKGQGLAKTYTVCDCEDAKSIVDLCTKGVKAIPCKKGRGSVKQGIAQMKQFKIHITKRSANLLDEADNYVWIKDEATGLYTNEPIDKWNHAFDAARYGLDYLMRKYRPKNEDTKKD